MNRFILILAILNISYTLSKEGKMSFERLKAIKMTYITEKLGLNENEETFFWKFITITRTKYTKDPPKK